MTEKLANDYSEKVQEIVAKYKQREGILVHLLQDIQQEFGYLSEEALEIASRELNIPFAQIYGVASFYTQLYFTPRGKNVIKVCVGTACHVRGAMGVLTKFEKELGIKAGETTADLKFTLETVNCVGCCGLAPVVVANERVVKKRYHSKLIARLKGGE
jgi:NADH:ubiquinone oxidoreductase subunit E